ncbi:MAG: hypothetical protein D8M59_03845 [Planctomycetes bacterium]|nr:hypothetical protein [Planctomycetota bacterium]NOG53128.1 hypothetical protein [Planctomycetota bacterium]
MATRKTQNPHLEHGELTRIIIGTVGAYTEFGPGVRPADAPEGRGIDAGFLAAKLNSWGITITKTQAATRLNELANEGQIERVSRGRYEGV